MNLTRVFEVALPELPARAVSEHAPRFPPDVVFKEHIEEGKPIVRAFVPTQEAMYRFPKANWELAQLFDGNRSYDEIARLYSAHVGVEYGTDEIREFAAAMEAEDFWYRTPQEKNLLLMQKDAEKRRKALRAKKSRWGDLAEISFPAVNPDKFLTWFHKHTSWIYTWWFTLLTLACFGFMAGITITYWSEIGRDTWHFFNFSEKTWADVAVFYLVAIGAMCWHEIGHGHACKHYGGRVPAMGFLLIYLTPAFYTDTTEGDVLGSRYERMVIALAGAWAELYICTVATAIWWLSPPDTVLHSVAYMMMLITGIASVLLNFNPLIKLDGYYIMSELLGLVDLKENSTAFVSAWVKRNIWGLPVEVPYVARRLRFGYTAYALISGLYSYTVLYIVARFVGNIFRNFNPDWAFVPELATAVLIFRSRIRALVNFMKFVYLDKKDRVWAWMGSRHPWAIGAVGALILFVPAWHDTVEGPFVLEPARTAIVRNVVPGTVTRVYAQEGKPVQEGEPLVELANLPLQSQFARTKADYEVAAAQANSAALRYADFGTADQQRDQLAKQMHALEDEVAGLDVPSPISGVVLTPRASDQVGSYVAEGTRLVEVADLSEMRARIFVSEHDVYKISVGAGARLEVDGVWGKFDANLKSLAPISSDIDPAISQPDQFKGLGTPNFYVAQLDVADSQTRLRPGMVGTARIYGARRSLAGLVWREAWRFAARKFW
ncbi:MAG TPA: efflux RND transporter periplasmic adaptor subunit [Candidatus Aquilonibacter sp.]|nr:efflux RND transporter periplasmic adaptor subunit [Candidatus Aquilonibacter sp.]